MRIFPGPKISIRQEPTVQNLSTCISFINGSHFQYFRNTNEGLLFDQKILRFLYIRGSLQNIFSHSSCTQTSLMSCSFHFWQLRFFLLDLRDFLLNVFHVFTFLLVFIFFEFLYCPSCLAVAYSVKK